MNDVIILAANVGPGDTLRTICPRCGGGTSQEKSLTITRSMDGGVVWNCFRDKCDEKGTSGYVSEGGYVRATPPPKKVKRFEGKTEALSEHRLRIIESKWGIQDPPYWYWTPDYGGRIAMSIRSPKFMHRGWVLRDIRGMARTKALTYIDEGEVPISWYKHQDKTQPLILVEDIPSAVRAAKYVSSVALLGTHLGIDRIEEIVQQNFTRVRIALDQDATEKAFRHLRKWGAFFNEVDVLPLPKDLKDMTEDELIKVIT